VWWWYIKHQKFVLMQAESPTTANKNITIFWEVTLFNMVHHIEGAEQPALSLLISVSSVMFTLLFYLEDGGSILLRNTEHNLPTITSHKKIIFNVFWCTADTDITEQSSVINFSEYKNLRYCDESNYNSVITTNWSKL
jgi:hypothetical protein